LAGKSNLDGGTQTLPALYQLPSSDFHDITSGTAGSFSAGPGYDLVTGLGSPYANLVVGGLVNYGSSSSSSGPTVATAASASPSTVTGTTTGLTVLGSDPAGASSLTYSWAVTASPSGAKAPTYSLNGTNGASSTTATFYMAGNYTFTVTIKDSSGLTTTSSVNVTVNQTQTSIGVTPSTTSVADGKTQQLTATALDQFGLAMKTQPTSWTWSLASGSGLVSTGGLYTAPGSGSGSAKVQAADTTSSSGAATVSYGTSPSAPSNLAVTSSTRSQVNLSWTDNSGNESGFIIQRSTNNATWTQVGSVAAGATKFTDRNVKRNTTYYYRVYAWNSYGNSGYSNVASTVTPHVTSAVKTNVEPTSPTTSGAASQAPLLPAASPQSDPYAELLSSVYRLWTQWLQ
jgi:hypothetical protein